MPTSRYPDPVELPGGTSFRARKFADQAVEVIRHLILSGQVRPAERLNELNLAQTLGISRSPIREALQALAGEGLVRFVPGRGAFVAEMDLTAIRQLGQIREALECLGARLAAEHATDAELDDLDRSLSEAEHSLRAGNYPQPYPRDLDFHQQVLALSGNPRLAQAAGWAGAQLQLARLRSAQRPGRARQAFGEHRVILEALRGRDPSAAEAAMRVHLAEALANVSALYGGPDLREHRDPADGRAAAG